MATRGPKIIVADRASAGPASPMRRGGKGCVGASQIVEF